MTNSTSAWLEQALRFFQSGELAQAEALYRQVLDAEPANADALNMLGIIAHQTGRLAEAVRCYRQALAHHSRSVPILNNLGVVLKDLGQVTEAIACYRQALLITPSFADALDNLGLRPRAQGKLAEAAESCRQALRVNPQHAQAHNSLALILQELGQTNEALECYRQALRVNPQNAGAHYNVGAAFLKQRRIPEAIASLQHALRLQPRYTLAHYSLGIALKEQGHLDDAIASFRAATQCNPQEAVAFVELGRALLEKKDFVEAAQCLQHALRINPRLPNVHLQLAEALKAQERPAATETAPARVNVRQADSHNNLGLALMDEGKAAEAEQCFRHALSINPQHADAQNNLSNALLRQGRYAEAAEHNEKALHINPVHGVALWDRSLLRLLQGDFLGGWVDYEQRWALPEVPPRHFHRPRWDGSPLYGKTILLHTEQGLGDTLQFVRYTKMIKDLGGTIVLGCQPPLVSLLARMPELSEVFPIGAPRPPYDVHAPLLSLPGIFKTAVETIPAPVPYLTFDPARLSLWRHEVSQLPGFKIGIAWQGNPRNQIDRYRSVPLAHFAPLALLPGVTLISLQVSHGLEQMEHVPFTVVDLGSRFELSSLEDLAGAIMNIDLMVTSDSAIAHLAGALGAPIYTALGLSPDWRWLLERDDCPWYPTMRLFRQRRLGDWGDVFERIAAAVRIV